MGCTSTYDHHIGPPCVCSAMCLPAGCLHLRSDGLRLTPSSTGRHPCSLPIPRPPPLLRPGSPIGLLHAPRGLVILLLLLPPPPAAPACAGSGTAAGGAPAAAPAVGAPHAGAEPRRRVYLHGRVEQHRLCGGGDGVDGGGALRAGPHLRGTCGGRNARWASGACSDKALPNSATDVLRTAASCVSQAGQPTCRFLASVSGNRGSEDSWPPSHAHAHTPKHPAVASTPKPGAPSPRPPAWASWQAAERRAAAGPQSAARHCRCSGCRRRCTEGWGGSRRGI